MPYLKATKITLTKPEKKRLTKIANSRVLSAGHIRRSKIILHSELKIPNNEIARLLGISNKTVKYWRNRWADFREDLNNVIKTDNPEKQLSEKIDEILTDRQRSGCPARITPEQKAQIISLACEKPEKIGLPFSHWSIQELLNEIKKRKIVEEISWTRVQNFLKYGRSKTAS